MIVTLRWLHGSYLSKGTKQQSCAKRVYRPALVMFDKDVFFSAAYLETLSIGLAIDCGLLEKH